MSLHLKENMIKPLTKVKLITPTAPLFILTAAASVSSAPWMGYVWEANALTDWISPRMATM
jgi:hypothetical protein